MPQTTPNLFLSYSRQDDERFVRRLYADLVAAGFDVWFDRASMPSRSLTFYQEIADAIRARDRLIVVVGPAMARSDYVTQEWRWALGAEKIVNPIYRSGPDDYALVPEDLRHLHCEDFRDDSEYAGALARLIAQLRTPPPPLGRLVAVPGLPPHLVARAEHLRVLRDAVTEDLRRPVALAGAGGRVGVHGMGGVGKTILAQVLAHDREVRRAYPDGIVWLVFGQHPEVVRLQRFVVAMLGSEASFSEVAVGRDVLRGLLLDKAVILVCDDLWHPGPFRDGFDDTLGPRCRALVTTRDVGVLRHLAATHHAVDVLSDAEAIALLTKAAHWPDDIDYDVRRVARLCGNLPLALALCGGMARGPHGIAWSTIADALARAELESIADDHQLDVKHRSIWRAIKVGVDALRADERARFTELAIFPEDEAVPDKAVEALWSLTTGGRMSDLACDALLRRLWESSLIDLQGSVRDGDSGKRVSMHDLVRSYARRIAGDDLKAIHHHFAEASRRVRATRPESFSGYFKDALPLHLVQADDPIELLALLGDPELGYFHQWSEQGFARRGVECLEFLFDRLSRSPGQANLLPALATQLARLQNRLGDPDEAERWLRLALDSTQTRDGFDQITAVALHELGSAALSRGDLCLARRAYRRALRDARRATPALPHEIAANLIGLAVVAYLASPGTRRAVVLGKLALAFAEEAQDAPHVAEACRILGDASKDQMDYAAAEEYFARGMDVAKENGLTHARLSLLTAQAWMAYQRAVLLEVGLSEPETVFRELLETAEAAGDPGYQGNAWSGLGQVALLSDNADALDLAIGKLSGDDRRPEQTHLEVRRRLLEAGRLLRSERWTDAGVQYSGAAEYGEQHGLWSRRADALVGQGCALFRAGSHRAAEECWQRADAALERCPPVRQRIARRCIQSCRENASEWRLLL